MERQAMRLQVEEKALQKEKDKASKERLHEIAGELAALQEKLRPLQLKYKKACRPACRPALPQRSPACIPELSTVHSLIRAGWCYREAAHAVPCRPWTAACVRPGPGTINMQPADRLPPSSPLLLPQEKARLDEIKALQKKKEDLAIRLENAQNRLDLAMVADIK